MKIGSIRLSTASLALLVIQLAIVLSVAGKYLYQRWTCPRVWVQTVAYDPALFMRGRYLGLQLIVDGCESTLPSGAQAQFPRNADGTVASPRYNINGPTADFPAKLEVKNNRLLALRLPDSDAGRSGQMVSAVWQSASCDQLRLVQPVNFYIAEHADSPFTTRGGGELWVEVTVPPKGPPRPIQLAMKRAGAWTPLEYQ
jgi:hypothetical protein